MPKMAVCVVQTCPAVPPPMAAFKFWIFPLPPKSVLEGILGPASVTIFENGYIYADARILPFWWYTLCDIGRVKAPWALTASTSRTHASARIHFIAFPLPVYEYLVVSLAFMFCWYDFVSEGKLAIRLTAKYQSEKLPLPIVQVCGCLETNKVQLQCSQDFKYE